MKLFLSSVGIPQPAAYRELFANKQTMRIGLIANAWGTYPAGKREPFISQTTTQLTTLGATVQPLDLLDYAGKQGKLQKALQSLDGLWVTGGNSFYLNWAAHQAGMQYIIGALCRDGLVYGGESAGAILATPTLHGVEFVDDANDAPEVLWDGLGLISFGLVPHWGNPKYAELLASCRQEMEKHVKAKILTDTQCLVVVDDHHIVLG